MIFLIYAVAFFLVFGFGLVVFKLCVRWGRMRAWMAAALALIVTILIWPIPVHHGGFTFLLAVAWHELSQNYRQNLAAKQTAKENLFLANLDHRFKGPLDIYTLRQLNAYWFEVESQNGTRAWLDESSKMLWSELILLETTTDFPSLAMAKATCADLPPKGYWSLATEAEHFTFWRSGGADVFFHVEHSIVSYVVDEQLGIELPTYVLSTQSSNANVAPQRSNTFAASCVARTRNAPLRGYMKRDISLEDWNEYQLRKMTR